MLQRFWLFLLCGLLGGFQGLAFASSEEESSEEEEVCVVPAGPDSFTLRRQNLIAEQESRKKKHDYLSRHYKYGRSTRWEKKEAPFKKALQHAWREEDKKNTTIYTRIRISLSALRNLEKELGNSDESSKRYYKLKGAMQLRRNDHGDLRRLQTPLKKHIKNFRQNMEILRKFESEKYKFFKDLCRFKTFEELREMVLEKEIKRKRENLKLQGKSPEVIGKKLKKMKEEFEFFSPESPKMSLEEMKIRDFQELKETLENFLKDPFCPDMIRTMCFRLGVNLNRLVPIGEEPLILPKEALSMVDAARKHAKKSAKLMKNLNHFETTILPKLKESWEEENYEKFNQILEMAIQGIPLSSFNKFVLKEGKIQIFQRIKRRLETLLYHFCKINYYIS